MRNHLASALLLCSCGGSVEANRATPERIPDASEEVDVGLGGAPPKDAAVEASPPTCDAAPPPIVIECDPIDAGSCAGGACSYTPIFGKVGACGLQVYGYQCVTAGVGEQGEPCQFTSSDPGINTGCSPGFVCTTGGKCAAQCKVGAPDACAPGLVCSASAGGYGVCL